VRSLCRQTMRLDRDTALSAPIGGFVGAGSRQIHEVGSITVPIKKSSLCVM
jgi:hypothetical protein